MGRRHPPGRTIQRKPKTSPKSPPKSPPESPPESQPKSSSVPKTSVRKLLLSPVQVVRPTETKDDRARKVVAQLIVFLRENVAGVHLTDAQITDIMVLFSHINTAFVLIKDDAIRGLARNTLNMYFTTHASPTSDKGNTLCWLTHLWIHVKDAKAYRGIRSSVDASGHKLPETHANIIKILTDGCIRNLPPIDAHDGIHNYRSR